MIAKFLGRVAALPIRVAAVPFRVLDRMVGVDDRSVQATPGTMLRDVADAVQRSVEEIGR
jgi:FAD/FMN-containing dehydrogenase